MKVQTLTAFIAGGEGSSGQHTAPRDWVPLESLQSWYLGFSLTGEETTACG